MMLSMRLIDRGEAGLGLDVVLLVVVVMVEVEDPPSNSPLPCLIMNLIPT